MNEAALIYEYAVVRYVPRVEREEFINVGLLMMCKRRRWMRGVIAVDRKRLLTFDPDADMESLDRQLKMFDTGNRVIMSDLPVEERFRWLTAVKSAVIQTSRPHPGLLSEEESLDDLFDRLLAELVL